MTDDSRFTTRMMEGYENDTAHDLLTGICF